MEPNIDIDISLEDKKQKVRSVTTKRDNKTKSHLDTTFWNSSKPKKTTSPQGKDNDKNKKNAAAAAADDDDDELSIEEVACCLCHCGVDCSDRALFFKEDRIKEWEEEGEYYFHVDGPYMDAQLYDRNNALVYCDSCDRLYHQKCHFVPLLVLPRGDWQCLICSMMTTKTKMTTSSSSSKKAAKHNQKANYSLSTHVNQQQQQQPWTLDIMSQLFMTPPVSSLMIDTTTTIDPKQTKEKADHTIKTIETLQKEWELYSRHAKAVLWNGQLKQIKNFLSSQISNIRQAQATLETLCSTKRNRQHFLVKGKQGKNSQELAQTILRFATAKWKIRDVLQSLESIRIMPQPGLWDGGKNLLQKWCQEYPEHEHHVFPYGRELYEKAKRTIPRTREMKVEDFLNTSKQDASVPTEISVPSSESNSNGEANLRSTKTTLPSKVDSHDHKKPHSKLGKDDDSGITLDDLQCCICFIGDASDENDVLLCDGQGCYRAFHMKCIHPEVTLDDIANEDENWFCPLCSSISNFILYVQSTYMDEDWEQRRAEGDDSSSLKSWGHVDEVFPDAEWQYEVAMQLKKGENNADTHRLLTMFLGEDFDNQRPGGATIPQSDDEDENDYSLFDENSFEERRRKEREAEVQSADSDDSSETTRSSQATLVEMSSVELSIGEDELAAIASGDDASDGSSSSSRGEGSEENEHEGGLRRSRRLRHVNQSEHSGSEVNIGADFNEANIIHGKRKRKAVDYRKLNDALFGDLTEYERAQIDDTEDFKARSNNRRRKWRGSQKKAKIENEETEDAEGSCDEADSVDIEDSGSEQDGSSSGEEDDNGDKGGKEADGEDESNEERSEESKKPRKSKPRKSKPKVPARRKGRSRRRSKQ